MVDDLFLEIKEHNNGGFKPCVDFGEWRVAILCYNSDVEAKNISYLERHNETDEVFVLLKGRCILLIGGNGREGARIQAVDMDTQKLYNIKKGAYHHHVLSKDAVVLIVENRDTGNQNSDRVALSVKQKEDIIKHQEHLWGK
jgi:hypothetical protein